MKIAALRYTYRFNVGNYQHEEIAVEAVPDDGQTAESLLSETRAFVHENRPGSQGAPVANGNGKPSAAPPLAAKKEAGPDPTTAPTPQPSTTASTTQTGGKRGRGRPPKAVSDARKAVAYAKESATLEDLLDRMHADADKPQLIIVYQ